MHRFRVGVLLLAGILLLQPKTASADRPYQGGVVASAYPDAARAGLDMLDHGGNAVDAAVAMAFAAGVVAPYHNGVGGGGFALVYQARTRTTLALDFREVAPAGASRDMYLRDGKVVAGLSTDGALAVAVPAAAQGYLALLQRAGTLTPSVVLAPAIRLAREGFLVTPKYQAMARLRVECLAKDSEAARLFLRPGPDGAPAVPPLGTRLRQPELARTLQRLALEGASAVTTGSIAHAIQQTTTSHGGVLTAEDLARYRVRWREALWGGYRGHALAVFPPPTAGGVAVLQVLGMLEQLRPSGLDRRGVQDLHLYIEALAARLRGPRTLAGRPGLLRHPAAAAALGKLPAGAGSQHRRGEGDVLLSAVAQPHAGWRARPCPGRQAHHPPVGARPPWQCGVATTTLNGAFGSCLVARGTGILLNNQMDDFAAQPMQPNMYGVVTGEANAIAPGKTPLSSMSPTLVFQKSHPERVLMALGSPGAPPSPPPCFRCW